MFGRILLLIFALAVAYPAFGADAPSARLVVPSHDIARGQVIGDADLVYLNVAGTVLPGIEVSMSDLEGMEARRVLRAGEAIRTDDVRRPILVTRGSTVTMTFEAPGVTLTATGRAMTEGGYGETVTIQNPVSYRQVSAVVTGAGQVRAGFAPTSLAGGALVASAGR